MNRIYQGRVCQVEIPDPANKTTWKPLKNWEDALWQHHQLFQDAVNYYLVALAALGQSPQSTLSELRLRITEAWHSVEKQGQKREGMSESFRRRFGDIAAESFSHVSCIALDQSLPDAMEAEKCADFLMAKATGDSGIQQQGSQLWPQFCNPCFAGNFSGGTADDLRNQGSYILSTKLHELDENDEQSIREFANARKLSDVVKTDPEENCHENSKARLHKSVLHFLKVLKPELKNAANKGKNEAPTIDFLKNCASSENELLGIEQEINQGTNPEPIIKNNKGKSDQIEALLLFKFFPRNFTLNLLKVQFPQRPDRPDMEVSTTSGESSVNFSKARGERKYIFRAFTSLAPFGSSQALVDDNHGWALFDIAAFKEALKVVNQFNQNRKNREEKLNALATRLLVMDGETSLALYTTEGTDGKIRARLERLWRECNGKPKLASEVAR